MIKMTFILLTLCLGMTASQAQTIDSKIDPPMRLSLAMSQNISPVNLQAIKIERMLFGSGSQEGSGTEKADPVADFGVWHAPQYMPGFPTSATIWPRVVDVRCADNTCSGYAITPEMGRGEYLFFRPVKQ